MPAGVGTRALRMRGRDRRGGSAVEGRGNGRRETRRGGVGRIEGGGFVALVQAGYQAVGARSQRGGGGVGRAGAGIALAHVLVGALHKQWAVVRGGGGGVGGGGIHVSGTGSCGGVCSGVKVKLSPTISPRPAYAGMLLLRALSG